ncbi:c-type cytochrome [Psychrobacter sp. CAL346-MNA-CIBAN-0220]|uniref:c-type cytochrome n=1 Tax=Psychrobacter sp. CAL346-MNA-CIBAN-0220 TaxID=3140457 RepID=UPI00332D1714
MKKTVINSSLSTALWTALIVTLGIGVSACSSDKESEEVMAVDRVEDAAALAIKNGPEAEDMAFPETAPVAAADANAMATTDQANADMPVDAAATTEVAGAAKPEDLAVNVGAQLYNTQCMACHQNGLLNAPKYGDAAAWAPRIAKGKEILYTHSAKGFNQMPPQATNGVTEAQIHAAVDYMVAAAS